MAGALSLFGGADVFGYSDKKARIKLTRLKPEDDTPDGTLAFQYWPESITDTKATNWQNKVVPGGNLPIYAWINGAERVIAFSAMFATDVDVTKWTQGIESSVVVPEFVSSLKQKGLDSRNIDVRGALLWLRSFLMPEYKDDGTFLPPPKVQLTIPGSRIGMYAGSTPGNSEADSIVAVMTQCDFDYKAFWPNGVPRIVTVQLSFAQTPQLAGIVQFPGRTTRVNEVLKNGGDGIGNYKIGKSG